MRNDFRRSPATPFSFSLSRTRPSPKNALDGRRERKSEKGNDFISFIRSGQLNVRDVLAGQWPMNECKSLGRFPHSLCCRLKPRECCERKRPQCPCPPLRGPARSDCDNRRWFVLADRTLPHNSENGESAAAQLIIGCQPVPVSLRLCDS